MIAKKVSDRSKILLTAMFILALLAAQFIPAMADDNGPKTTHVTYVKGQTPVFGDSGPVKGDVPAQKALPASNNKVADGPKADVTLAPPPATVGNWKVIYGEGFETISIPGGGWTATSINGSDICWDDVDTSNGALAFNGSWSIWPSDGCTNGQTPTGSGGIYQNNIETSIDYGPFSLAGYSDAQLTFMLNSISEAGWDYFCFSTSADGTNFDGQCISGNTNGWLPETVSLSKYKGDSSVWFEFYFYSDGSNGAQGPFVDDVYLLGKQALSYNSSAGLDGWILESTESSNKGGTLNTSGTTFYVGDNGADKQYKSIVSFDTHSIPDTATITDAILKFRIKTVVGDVSSLGRLYFDTRIPKFGSSLSLQTTDFQATPSTLGNSYPSYSLGKGWYFMDVYQADTYINKTGTTQLRLYFSSDDNDDGGADYLNIYSGDSGTNAPKLIVEYTLP